MVALALPASLVLLSLLPCAAWDGCGVAGGPEESGGVGGWRVSPPTGELKPTPIAVWVPAPVMASPLPPTVTSSDPPPPAETVCGDGAAPASEPWSWIGCEVEGDRLLGEPEGTDVGCGSTDEDSAAPLSALSVLATAGDSVESGVASTSVRSTVGGGGDVAGEGVGADPPPGPCHPGQVRDSRST